MALSLLDKYARAFISNDECFAMQEKVNDAHHLLHSGIGAGNDFIGWLDLPVNYNKDEFARIKKAAEKIKSDTDVFIVIGIGGSYLGARAVIEFVKGQCYNAMAEGCSKIYFTGNSICRCTLQGTCAHIQSYCNPFFHGFSLNSLYFAQD